MSETNATPWLSRNSNSALTGLLQAVFSVALILSGLVLILLAPPTANPTPVGTLLYNMGLSASVAGVITLFHVLALKRTQDRETANEIAKALEDYFVARPLLATGIRLLSEKRQGITQYYSWCIAEKADELMFAGRSVLHRIDKDLSERGAGSVVDALIRRLREGSQVTIMFVDPRSDIIPRIASEEGQTERGLLRDLASSVAISYRLYEAASKITLPNTAKLEIMIYDLIPYFAYHRVDDDAIVGFYFSSIRGDQQAAYQVVDSRTRDFFEHHYLSLKSSRGKTDLVNINRHRSQATVSHAVFGELRTFFEGKSVAVEF